MVGGKRFKTSPVRVRISRGPLMPECKKCGQYFPYRIVINGRTRSLSKRKYCLSCHPFGEHNIRNLESEPPIETAVLTICKTCGKKFYYYRNSNERSGDCKTECNSCSTNKKRFNIKQRAIDYKGGKCVNCGYNKCSRALVFHHINESEKKFTISCNHCRCWEVLKEELDKCILLCANCHAELHFELHFNSTGSLTGQNNCLISDRVPVQFRPGGP